MTSALNDPLVRARFESKVDRSGGPDACHLWTDRPDEDGYGRFFVDGRTLSAPRVALSISVGPLADGLIACHRCDNPLCVNSAHLFVGTQLDNMRDAAAKRRVRSGLAHPRARISAAQEVEIREARSRGESIRSIASRFGVSRSFVWRVERGARWTSAEAA